MRKSKYILASKSPRRIELLNQIGIDAEVIVSEVDESIDCKEPSQVVKELSLRKATKVMELLSEKSQSDEDEWTNVFIIGADTVVSCAGEILGKPKDREDARRMLKLLNGNTHEVYSGVTVIRLRYEKDKEVDKQINTFAECTEVSMYPMNEEEIDFYLESGECDDKAGAYGIQGICARYISGIKGDYNTVVGLPVGRVYQVIKSLLSE